MEFGINTIEATGKKGGGGGRLEGVNWEGVHLIFIRACLGVFRGRGAFTGGLRQGGGGG